MSNGKEIPPYIHMHVDGMSSYMAIDNTWQLDNDHNGGSFCPKDIGGSTGVVPFLLLSQICHFESRVGIIGGDGGTWCLKSVFSSRPDNVRRRDSTVVATKEECPTNWNIVRRRQGDGD